MKKIFKLFSLFFLAILVSNCEEYDAGTENAQSILNYGFKFESDNFDVPEGNPVYKIVVFATQTSNVDRVINVDLDDVESDYDAADLISYPQSITIPAGSLSGEGEIVFDADNLVLGEEGTLYFDLVNPADGMINRTADRTRIIYAKECLFNQVDLNITFDNYPEETAWRLFDSDSNVIASGGFDGSGNITGYAVLGYADASTFSTKFCLESGNYSFVIYDDYGDGMYTNATVQGNYSIKFGDVVLGSGGGNFGLSQTVNFTL